MTQSNPTTPARSMEELEDRAIAAMDQLVTIVEQGVQCYGTNGKPLVLPNGKPQCRPAPASYHAALQRWLRIRAQIVDTLHSARPRADGISHQAAALAEMAARGRESSLLADDDDFSEARD